MTARVRAAGALRRLSHALAGHEVDDVLLEQVGTDAQRWAELAADGPSRARHPDSMRHDILSPPAEPGEPIHHWDDCPVSGVANPLSIGLTATREGDEAVGRVTLGAAHEGAPGRAHGGIVAACFDDTMGFLIAGVLSQAAYVVDLRIRYRAPTPLHEPLEFRARAGTWEGRKLTSHATASHHGRVIAEATGLHLTVTLEQAGPASFPAAERS